jgi:hypothetical protein
MKSIWIVWDYDWVQAELTILVTCRTREEADKYIDDHWGHGYSMSEVHLPSHD